MLNNVFKLKFFDSFYYLYIMNSQLSLNDSQVATVRFQLGQAVTSNGFALD